MKPEALIVKLPTYALLSILLLFPALSAAETTTETVTLLLTSNLKGKFTVSTENQDQNDPMLVMAQSLINERNNKGADLLIDLGNAFYPGLLSRFSYGSLMMDYLDYIGFSATLVSSQDLNIGINNLEFLSQRKKTALLSANIEKNGQPVFAPYMKARIKGKTIAFVGITNPSGFFDIAEKELFDASFSDINTTLSITIDKLRLEQTDHIVLLSGLSYEDNVKIMKKNKDVSLCISGGDNRGQIYTAKAKRVDLDSGRSLVTLTNTRDYHLLTLALGEKLEVGRLVSKTPRGGPTDTQNYIGLVKRLSLWKSRFAVEGDETVAEELPGEVQVDVTKVAELLRHRFAVEIVMLGKNTITPGTFSGRVTYSDVITMVNNELPIFTYRLSGKELKTAVTDLKQIVVTGTDGKSVQGYPIDDKRNYLICSTQQIYDRLTRKFNRAIPFKNSWKTVPDEIRADLKGERIITRKDFSYLDRRFALLVDVYLSNFYEQSDVSRGDKKDVPPGKPADSYTKWGIEDQIDFTIYNRYHKLILTPYIYFVSKDDDYLQNILRGTLFYTYNLNTLLKPYHKSQVDTVVQVVDEQRPVIFRETVGAFFETQYLTGKLGVGFEKQTRDPEKEVFNGFEAVADADIDLWQNISYVFNLDSFYGFERIDTSKRQLRSSITNGLSFKINSFLALSAKHKWTFFDATEYKEKYTESLVLLGLDVTTDFKVF
ncbi:MAG: hypothetical protein ACOZF0_21900 [Thermodesulfobacteriota bacterium]